MSRSRKKHPIYKFSYKGGKRAAARAFRRFKEEVPVSTRQFYRRVYNSYNVFDNWWLCSNNSNEKARFKWLMNELERNEVSQHLTEEEAYEYLEEMKELKYCFSDIGK